MSQRPAPPSSPHAASALHRLALDAGLLVDWEDAAGRPMRVSDDVLRAVLRCLGLPADSAADEADSRGRLLVEAAEHAVPPLVTGVAGHAVLLETAPPWAATLGGRPYRIGFEHGGGTEGTVHASIGHDRATLRLAPVPAPGYHRLRIDTGSRTAIETTLAIAPARCYAVSDALQARGRPPDARLWGGSAQLYGLRHDGERAALSAGLGDYTAAGLLARSLARHGADALALSPVHAMFSADTHRYAPYSPSSRLFLNAWMIDPAALLGAEAARQAVSDAGLADDCARLEANALIDWPASAAARLTVLRALHRRLRMQAAAGDSAARRRHEDMLAHCAGQGGSLLDHAHFEALDAHLRQAHPPLHHWQHWPAPYRSPSYLAVRAFARDHPDAVDFHRFLQWAAARQLAAAQRAAEDAGMAIGLIADLAVGTDGAGSHAWSRQQDLLIGLTVGAPPDVFNAQGQSWGLTTFSPRAMRTQGFAAFLDMLRAVMAVPGGVRIDHVLGLMRLWVIPDGARALDGVYLRYPLRDLLRLIALESWRNRCIVIGEDLGTVPAGLREQLADAGLLGMRILWFERDYARPEAPFRPPQAWSPASVAMTSTHDLPTVAGWWTGHDLHWQARLGLLPIGMNETEARTRRMADRRALVGAFAQHHRTTVPTAGDDAAQRIAALQTALAQARTAPPAQVDTLLAATAGDFATAALAYAAAAPVPLAIAPMEDLLGLLEQPNLPSTIETHPNWRRRLSAPAAGLLAAPAIRARLAALARSRANADPDSPP
ncbi:4-alpha-glucanotransferase [Ralstonia pseudosolanacearum]|uniref:4-alpha-glucanotransferase n=1 Tax=Ralstonia pseudosolanacearum TaxID=1310165 RepID=UPI002676CC7B|nr:4-alpha-glucanotransferase [Ralstonia pseudosolanacearum]MDO3528400.1 4-alpha-glucanotransferase [Ralstonia pseudosolanacearum]